MLNGVHFYHATIKRVVSVFGTIFNNIVVGRHSGDKISNISRVPISYGPRQKFLARINQNLEEQRVAIKLPRMSFEITSIEYDTSTKLNRLNKTITTGDSPGNRNSMFQSVPYTLGMQLNIMAKNQEDALQILEQILPTFSPEYTVAIKDIEGVGSKTDVPFILNSVSFTDDYEADMITRRTIIYTLDFTIRVRFAPDVSKVSIIKRVETDIADFTNVASSNAESLSSVRVSADSPSSPITTFVSLINPDDVQTINLAFKDFTLSGLTPLNEVTSISIASGSGADADRVKDETLTTTLTNLTGISEDSGTNTSFTTLIDGITGNTNSITIINGGSGHQVSDRIIISEAPYNISTLVLDVTTIDSSTPIDYFFTNLSGSISGTGARLKITKTGSTYTLIVRGGQSGSGFVENETITIPGTSLGGASTTHDATVTITSVSSGVITGVSITGTGLEEGAITGTSFVSGHTNNATVAASFTPTFSRVVSDTDGLTLEVSLDKTGAVIGTPTIIDGGAGYTQGTTKTFSPTLLGEGEVLPFYNNEKTHNTTRFRNWTIYEYDSSNNRQDYKIYYIDSEWSTAGNGSPSEQVSFTGLQNAFNDGSQWRISAENANSTGTFTLIVVRLSDGVIKKCVGVASDEKLANNTLWTVTDVTGQVNHLGNPGNSPTTPLVINIDSINSSVISGTYIRSGVLNNRPKYILTGDTNTVISYDGESSWELTQGNTIIASNLDGEINAPTNWRIDINSKLDESITITSTDTGDFTIGEEVQGNTSLGLASIVSSSNDIVTANDVEAQFTDGEILTGLTSGVTRTVFNTIIV